MARSWPRRCEHTNRRRGPRSSSLCAGLWRLPVEAEYSRVITTPEAEKKQLLADIRALLEPRSPRGSTGRSLDPCQDVRSPPLPGVRYFYQKCVCPLNEPLPICNAPTREMGHGQQNSGSPSRSHLGMPRASLAMITWTGRCRETTFCATMWPGVAQAVYFVPSTDDLHELRVAIEAFSLPLDTMLETAGGPWQSLASIFSIA